MWTCGLTAPSQHCSHHHTCNYKQVAPYATTLPTGHSSTRTRPRSISWPQSRFADQTPGTLCRLPYYTSSDMSQCTQLLVLLAGTWTEDCDVSTVTHGGVWGRKSATTSIACTTAPHSSSRNCAIPVLIRKAGGLMTGVANCTPPRPPTHRQFTGQTKRLQVGS